MTLEGEQLPRIVESAAEDRVVWSSPWREAPGLFIQFDLADDGAGGTVLRWTLLTPTPAPSIATINQLREQASRLVNIDLRNALTY
ncbi:hypothetical protein [Rhodococcus sp. KRD197]|uniref:hypothetical protein n=1 Tax=Rhodococcus sp. KRD197 TaxID=2729731 RepID=UPI0019D2D28C|nr:hypothetical protein [Rhodococcus sp. KRD197]